MERKKILIIDDDEDFGRILHSKFQLLSDFVFEIATTGSQGISLAKKYHPDLIILDIMLQDMNGIKVLNKLKQLKQTIETPVFILSGKDDETYKTEASYAYCEKYLVKPIDVPLLIIEIQTLFSRQVV